MSDFIKAEAMWRLDRDGVEALEDFLVPETSLELFVNGHFLQSLKCLPVDLETLALGFLVSEGYLSRPDDLVSLELNPEKRTLMATLRTPPAQLERARLLSQRTPEEEPAAHFLRLMNPEAEAADRFRFRMTLSDVVTQFAQFSSQSETFRKVGGVHSAALSDGKQLLYTADDISRHNAMDRVIGAAFLDGRELGAMAVFTTGRLHLDMVTKLAVTGIPLCVTRSAPTRQALAVAKRCGLTLCGRVRPASALVFCGLERLVGKP